MKTRSVAFTLLTTIAILTMVASGAIAQVSKPLSVQIGIGSSSSSSARDAAGSTQLHAGAALTLTDTTTLFALPGSEGIDIDYNHSSGHGGHLDAYGATYTNRISLIPKIAQPLTARVVPYVGFGIGIFRNQVSKRVTTNAPLLDGFRPDVEGTTTTTKSGSSTDLGGKLVAGVDTPTGVFVEASYIISGSAEGVRTDSINLSVGMHL